MQRFFVEPECIAATSIEITDREIIHQMTRVLRMRPGEECVFLDNSGEEFHVELGEISSLRVRAQIVRRVKSETEPQLHVTLYQALPKKVPLFEWVLEKGTEIGVTRFVPLITAHTERVGFSKRERWEKILKEAAEQSERGRIPELSEAVEFKKMVMEKCAHPRVLFHSRGELKLFSTLSPTLRAEKNIDLYIGPEGGFSEDEVHMGQAAGFLVASLGRRILRTETAGIAASSLLLL